MSLARNLLVTVVVVAAAPAAAQLSNRSISAEAGVSVPARRGSGSAETIALAATAWLDGELEAVARVAWWNAPRTADRAADGGGWVGTAGLRMSLLPDPLRPQLWVEAGWLRRETPLGPRDRIALGAGAGLEWFAVRDISLAVRCTIRGAGTDQRVDVAAGFAAYF